MPSHLYTDIEIPIIKIRRSPDYCISIVGMPIYGTVIFMLVHARVLFLSQYIRCLGWLVAAGGALAIVYGLHGVMNGHPFTAAGDATYRGLHSTVWALAVSWVIFACVTGNGGNIILRI